MICKFLAKKYYQVSLALLFSLGLPLLAGSTITELFISQHIEGSSFNKALEIYNGTGNSLDLGAGNFTIEIYFNGNGSPGNTINLNGTVADGDVFVIAHTSADALILAETDLMTNSANFNGNDTIVLRKNGVIVDAIGQIGFDPGSEWGSGNTSTANNTIIRKVDVCGGETDASNVYDPTIEWNGFPSNNFSDLGSHTTTCGSGAGAVIASCNSPAATAEGQALVHQVSATDADGTVVNIQISGINPIPAAGTITIGNLVPAGAVGGTATADISVSDQVPIGNYAVTIMASNNDGVPETGSCQLTVQISGILTIAEIQGTPTTQGPNGASPVAGLSIQTTGIVTAVKSDGFFMQMVPGDGNPNSSDGIFVFTGALPTVVVGDEAQVNGDLVEFFGYTEFTNSPVVQINSSGNALPSPVLFDTQFPNSELPATQMERIEGMLASVVNGTIATPGRVSFGINIFYAVANGQPRYLREAGIDAPGLPNLPVFDGNPEAIRIDVNQIGMVGGFIDPTAGQTVTATGPVEFAFSEYRLLADATLSVSGPSQARPIRNREVGEFTVAAFNMEFLDAGNVSKTLKASKAILDVLKAPDIVALQEVVNQAALDALRNQIAADDPTVNYTAMVPADTDGFNQEVAYLIKGTVSSPIFSELGVGETYPNSSAGCSLETLHNRPPYVLDCTITPPGGQAYNLTVINLHLRSLSNVDNSVQGERVRMKRLTAARSLAGHIQTMQNNDPNRRILVVGDFNAFSFTDGYVDVIGIITGNPDFDLIESNTYAEILNPKLLPLSSLLPATEKYSFVFGKNAQQLDHIVATANFDCDISGFEFARLNADFPESVYENDTTRPERSSDHDPPVVFIQTNATPLPVLAVKDALVLEGTAGVNTILSFGVTLCSPSAQTVMVDWSLQPGLAQPGSDYIDISGTLTFPPNSIAEQVDVDIFADAIKESNETLFLTLQNPTNAVLGDVQGQGTLLNDDQVDPLRLAITPSILRLDGHQVLKAWPMGGTGFGTFGFQWQDVSPIPVFMFNADANPVIINMALADPAAFRVLVSDILGNQIEGTCIIGDPLPILAPAWLKSAPDFEWDNDNLFSVADWTAIINFSQQGDNTYPCDP